MQTRTRRVATRAGFTLMEVLVVVAIIVILAGAGGYIYMSHLENAKKDLAKTGAMALDQQVNAYRVRHGDYPPDLLTLTQPGSDGTPAALESKVLLDPWSRPYVYEPANLHPLTRKPHIYSEGPSPGTPGSRVSNWETNQ
jgi:general secretion pathway protein G